MFVREKTVKSNGKTYRYLHLLESYREDGKPKQRVILSLGRAEDFDRDMVDNIVSALSDYTGKMEVIDAFKDCHHGWSKNYGDIYVMEKLWGELKLDSILEALLAEREHAFDVLSAIKALVFNRAIDAQSKLSTYEWLKEEVYFPGAQDLSLHHLYRAMDVLIEHKKQLESMLYEKLTNLMNFDVSVVFYDCSLVDMYGESPGLVEYSRKGRPQFLISLVLSRDGLPLGHEVLPGNTPDIKTVKEAVEKLKDRFAIGRCIFVCDRGMVSRKKLQEIQDCGYDYIVGVRINQWTEVQEEVLTRPGRYREVAENLKVKEVDVDGRRYILCYNPLQAKRDKTTREAVVKALEEEIEGLHPESKRAAALYGHPFKGRYLRRLKDGTLKIDRMRLREDENYDGKYILLTSETKMDTEEIATTYKRLNSIERSFRSLKSLQDMEPVYHHADRRIRAHVSLCVLSHLLERYMEKKLGSEGLSLTASKALRTLGRMKATRVTIKDSEYLIRTDSKEEISAIFKALHYRPPSRVEKLGKSSAKNQEQ